ncbi:MAG: DMT family transporter [Candidatus Saccharimonadales bacterium]
MNWIAYSLLMFFSSVALYLCVRKSSLVKIPTALTNLAMFAIPLIAYVIIGTSSNTKFSITAWHLVMLVVTAVVFAYGGNTMSLKAIEIAPNPGYSLVLSKSYVLFTTIVAVVFLNQGLTWRKAIAILLIVAFSALILVNRKSARHVKDNKWIWLSLGSFFAWGMLSLSSKYLFSHGVATYAFLIYLYALVTICIVSANKMGRKKLQNITTPHWLLLLGTGIFSALFNLVQFEAIRLAPNVGYVNAINAGSISLVTVLAVLLFKDELTSQKAIGIAGVTVGILLLLV